MANIVTVNVNIQNGATPSSLQRTGAIVSTGGTNLAANAKSLLTQPSDLTPLLAAAVSITAGSTTWTTGVVTMTTATPHGYTTGDSVTVTGFTGVGYTGYNGTYSITVTGATTFTYAQAATLTTPATGTAVVTDADVAELVAQVTTFFAQGTSVSVYVLEIGHGTVTAGIAALSAYIAANPGVIYSFLVPRGWDADSTMVTLCNLYVGSSAKVYFFVTCTLSTYSAFATIKSVFMMIEAANLLATEFTAAAAFWVTLNYNPSPANQVTPLCFAFLTGVTSYGATAAQETTFKAANLNYVKTGAEGGISNKMLVWGVTGDGNPFNYWYSIDWMQVTVDQAIAAAIINGSNNPLAPLFFDQAGVNRLAIITQNTAGAAVANGLAVGPVSAFGLTALNFAALLASPQIPGGVVTNAVPFANYVQLAPGDYTIGKYSGLSISYTPARGFTSIVFNVNVSNFIP